MTPVDIVRRASLAGIDLGVVDGKLVASCPDGPPAADLVATITAHKSAIIVVLEAFATIQALRADILQRCLPRTPDDLPAAERAEAEALAADLANAGGLGQFVIDLLHTWNNLTARERLQAAWCWQVAIGQGRVERAA